LLEKIPESYSNAFVKKKKYFASDLMAAMIIDYKSVQSALFCLIYTLTGVGHVQKSIIALFFLINLSQTHGHAGDAFVVDE
jgi:hypothetical protein